MSLALLLNLGNHFSLRVNYNFLSCRSSEEAGWIVIPSASNELAMLVTPLRHVNVAGALVAECYVRFTCQSVLFLALYISVSHSRNTASEIFKASLSETVAVSSLSVHKRWTLHRAIFRKSITLHPTSYPRV